jgi:osmotically-inducible protein OsmY
MKTDSELRDDVISELEWDPQITDPDAIGVAVQDGAVTLTGHVPTYAERLAAARAAERVYGVKAVANDLQVKLAAAPRDDSDIARAIAHVLEWNVQVPEGKVHAQVQNGWVTLDGEVGYDYQRREVERMVRQVRGVIGVTDAITVKPPASPQKVQEVIEDAFKREAEVDARHISVGVSDHTAGGGGLGARDLRRGEPSRGLPLGGPPPGGPADRSPTAGPPGRAGVRRRPRRRACAGPADCGGSHHGPVRMILDFYSDRWRLAADAL